MRTRKEGAGNLGKMFQRSRTVIETSTSQGSAENAPTAPTIKVEEPQITVTPSNDRREITDSMLTQAWTSFALLLPENERALADRMKIMTPKVENQECFTISVDNQMAADLFAREEKRICEGMSSYLGNSTMKMNIVVNKVVVERHVSDKSKQYAILVEKNPLVEKLRKELNLEVAR